MKKSIALLLAFLLLLALAACGSKSPAKSPDSTEPATTSEPEVTPAPETAVDPTEIEWGYQAPGSSDTQYWYVDGDKSAASFLFFEDGYLTTVDGETRSTIDTKIVDKHIVDYDTDGGTFDFVFTDVLTCYDLVSGQWYMRSDYETVVDSLTGATFVCEAGSQWKYTFNADGTMVYDNDGTLNTGTWWIQDARTINNHYDDEGDTGGWFEITYEDESWAIKSIKDTDIFYPEK